MSWQGHQELTMAQWYMQLSPTERGRRELPDESSSVLPGRGDVVETAEEGEQNASV